jgi:hypothetical protein
MLRQNPALAATVPLIIIDFSSDQTVRHIHSLDQASSVYAGYRCLVSRIYACKNAIATVYTRGGADVRKKATMQNSKRTGN